MPVLIANIFAVAINRTIIHNKTGSTQNKIGLFNEMSIKLSHFLKNVKIEIRYFFVPSIDLSCDLLEYCYFGAEDHFKLDIGATGIRIMTPKLTRLRIRSV